MISKTYITKYNDFFRNKVKIVNTIHPAEWLLRFILGKWVGYNIILNKNDKVLDYSCGYGRNLEIFRDIEVDLYATEISKSIIKIIRSIEIFKHRKVKLSVGINGNLKFNNNFFKLIYACNSCYYVNSLNEFKRSMKEFDRILSDNGMFIFNVPTTQHAMIKKNKKNKNIAKISYDKLNIRNNESFYFAKSKKELRLLLSNFFKVVSIHKNKLELKDYVEDYFICVCIKK